MSWDEIEYFYFRRYQGNPRLMDREPVLLATARAVCVMGTDVIKRDLSPFPFWTPLSRDMPPTYGEVRWRGGVRAVRERVKRGGLGIEDRIRPWTGSFWRGLVISGALRVQATASWGRYQIWEATHSALVRDIEGAKMGICFEQTTGASGCRRLSRCPSMLLPAQDDLEVTAGLFAGSLLERDAKGDAWLVLPSTEAVISLLKRMTILFNPWRPFREKGRIVVSPFFGVLFASRMPQESAERIRAIRRPALGELLPLMYWTAYFGREGQWIPPFADALPFCISPRTYRRRRYGRSDLHKMAVLKYGILALAPPLRQAMMLWFRSKSATLGKGITPQSGSSSLSA